MSTNRTSAAPPDAALRRRLRPLLLATLLQGALLWVAVEKLFLDEIGFDAARLGIMAAAYAAIVPFLEVPSGIMADRWSRRNVLLVAQVALALCSLVGGLSTGMATYLVSAVLLGVYIAMQSGTLDSVVYDTVLEETGSSDAFERMMGRLRVADSAALVAGALAGAGLAAVTSPRITYLVTVPLVAASVPLLLRFREPTLHRVEVAEPWRDQVAATYRALLQRGRTRPVIATSVTTALLLQSVLEFGPLWLVTLAAPALLFGPHWAGLMAATGLGGSLGGRLQLDDRRTVTVVGALMVGCSATLTASRSVPLVIGAQVLLALLLVVVSIHLSRLLHDSVPSTIRAGVASGVGTLTWVAFLPFALAFGLVSDRSGVHAAGWLVVVATLATSATLGRLASSRRSTVGPCHPGDPAPVPIGPAPALVDA